MSVESVNFNDGQVSLTNVRFYKRTIPVIVGGKETGMEERDYVEISNPGDPHTVIDVEATDEYTSRYSSQWQSYKTLQDVNNGTSVMDWDGIPEGMRREFQSRGFNFIEQVAMAGDNAFMGLMGGIQWRQRARAYLELTTKKKEDDEMESLKRENAEIKAMLTELLGKKSPGRPKQE